MSNKVIQVQVAIDTKATLIAIIDPVFNFYQLLIWQEMKAKSQVVINNRGHI